MPGAREDMSAAVLRLQKGASDHVRAIRVPQSEALKSSSPGKIHGSGLDVNTPVALGVIPALQGD
jgi:hypothetical protein